MADDQNLSFAHAATGRGQSPSGSHTEDPLVSRRRGFIKEPLFDNGQKGWTAIMVSDRLYIIGNGFDLHHGIASQYRQFAAYLAQSDHTVFRMVEDYFSADEEFWADFEQRLAEFDAHQAIDYAMQFHSDERHGHFQYECEQIATGLSTGLRERFSEWIRSLRIPARNEVSRPLVIDQDALFLSFNYTPTLERV
ncbi:MAG: hypothetical protein F9K30_22240, partial [Dechloromonas sp.]